MTHPKSVLMVTMEPPTSHEDEFNDWYDTEHFPQRCALPGFQSGSRWVCLDGWPRWLAYYDLASAAALSTPEYKAVSGANSTPWSRRILPRTVGRARIIADAAAATSAAPLDPAPVTRLLLHGYPVASGTDAVALAAAVGASLGTQAHLIETRVYIEQHDGASVVWGVSLFAAPVLAGDLARTAAHVGGVGATVFNLYGPYRRGG